MSHGNTPEKTLLFYQHQGPFVKPQLKGFFIAVTVTPSGKKGRHPLTPFRNFPIFPKPTGTKEGFHLSRIENRLKKIRNQLHRAMRSDRPVIARELRYFEGQSRQSPAREEALERIEKRLENSIHRSEKRRSDCPRISCPSSLPISAHQDEIAAAIRSRR